MPYFFILLGFGAFFASAAIGTVAVLLVRPLRRVFPIACRVWLFGSVGFVCANIAMFGALWLLAGTGSFAPGSSPIQKVLGLTTVAMAALGPFVASGAGLAVGTLIGLLLGLRAVQATANLSLPNMRWNGRDA